MFLQYKSECHFLFSCFSFCLSTEHQLQFSGHCWRSKSEIVSQLLLWDPKHGRHSRGGGEALLDQLEEGTAIFRYELPAVKADKGEWDKLIKSLIHIKGSVL